MTEGPDVTAPESRPSPQAPAAAETGGRRTDQAVRRMPPAYPPPSPPEAFESHGVAARLLPVLYFGFLALVLVGSAGLLLWSSEEAGDELDPEELRALTREDPASAGVERSRWDAESGVDTYAPVERSTLHVTSSPAGAQVVVEGDTVGVTPLWLDDLPSRHHLVSVEMEGHVPRDTLLYLSAGLPATLRFSFLESEPSSEPSSVSGTAPGGRAEPPSQPSSAEAAPPAAPASGSLEIGATPAGATVRLDGRTVGTTPLVLDRVKAGEHTITLEREGFESASIQVRVEPGASAAVDVALVEQTGTISVVVRPWGSVYVDGVLRARDTDVSVEFTLPVGEHEVRVEHPGLGTQQRTVRVEPDRNASLAFDLN